MNNIEEKNKMLCEMNKRLKALFDAGEGEEADIDV